MAFSQISSYLTPRPSTSEEQGHLWLRLLRSRRVGATTFHRLMTEHDAIEAALEALPEIAAQAGVKNYQLCPPSVVDAEMRAGKAHGAELLLHGTTGYPKALYDLADAPPVLWAQGQLDLLDRSKIAIIGARNASSLGQRMARALAQELGAAGQVIVSGFARGIDTAAHRASLETGTIAVFAGGLDVIYPGENRALAEILSEKGVILSEHPFGLQPKARHFPARNRIISGLSNAVVVVEAATKSGSLLTARTALDQGREVLAVPGHPIDSRAAGCNQLIRDGACLVRRAQDVIDALQITQDPPQPELPLSPERPAPSLRDTAKLHMEILQRLGPSPLAEDQLIRDLQRPAHQITPVLTDLELKGDITRDSGGVLSRS